ncbi:MAG: helix-turn-helix transcriptional regulator [Alphaproteobacteria bacterium]|nr:helix-turn-helix transcriptional regulator [Alphaproteobacteria bacterium]
MTEQRKDDTPFEGLSWGELLKQYRFTRKMKQMALAEDLGVTQAMVSRWESDRVLPGREMQTRILELVRPEDLSSPVVGWRQFIAEMPAIGAVIDETGVFENVSAGFIREMKCSEQDLVSKRVEEVFEGDLPALFSSLKNHGLFDERIETVESVDIFSCRRNSGSRSEIPVHCMSWWRRGEDQRPRWILNGAKITSEEFRALRQELGGQIRVLEEIVGLQGGQAW